MFLTVFKVRF